MNIVHLVSLALVITGRMCENNIELHFIKGGAILGYFRAIRDKIYIRGLFNYDWINNQQSNKLKNKWESIW